MAGRGTRWQTDAKRLALGGRLRKRGEEAEVFLPRFSALRPCCKTQCVCLVSLLGRVTVGVRGHPDWEQRPPPALQT